MKTLSNIITQGEIARAILNVSVKNKNSFNQEQVLEHLTEVVGFSTTDKDVEACFESLINAGELKKKRVYYSLQEPQPVKKVSGKRISKEAAFDLMSNSKGRFFTVKFMDQKGSVRTMNCQYLANQKPSKVGYIKVRETSKLKTGENSIRNVNLQSIEIISMAGLTYKVK